MGKFFILVILVFLVQPVSAKKELSKNDIRKMYDDIFIVKVHENKGRTVFHPSVMDISENHLLSDFLKNNQSHIAYLLSNTVTKTGKLKNLEPFKRDPKKLQKEFVKIINDNRNFLSHFESILFNHVLSQGKNIKDYQKDQKEVKVGEMIDIAVKFFQIDTITPEGNYRGHICVDFNGLEDTGTRRDLDMEAFCFNVFFLHIEAIIPIYMKTANNIGKISLGINRENKILRAQGAMYLAISQNSEIRGLLKTEYLKRKNHLPFRIPGWE